MYIIKVGRSFIGETEWHLSVPNDVCQHICALYTKSWWNWPDGVNVLDGADVMNARMTFQKKNSSRTVTAEWWQKGGSGRELAVILFSKDKHETRWNTLLNHVGLTFQTHFCFVQMCTNMTERHNNDQVNWMITISGGFSSEWMEPVKSYHNNWLVY